MAMDGIFVDGVKQYFKPEDILEGDASAYTQQIAESVNDWLEENVTGGEQVTDTTLSLSGVPADSKVVGDEFGALKEDLSTLNSEGTVPTSGQMLSDNHSEDSVPYHFRKTASDNADREELEIVGGSVAWNQLVKNGNFADTSVWEQLRCALTVSNGVGTLACTEEISVGNMVFSNHCSYSKAGHKYFVTANIFIPTTNATLNSIGFGIRGNLITFATTGQWVVVSHILESSAANDIVAFANRSVASVDDYFMVKNVYVVDLTQALGSTIADYIYALEQATAGAGVALFKSLFPKDYYAYDAGSMQSVSGLSEHRTVGFNAWDEEWELGAYSASTGLPISSSERIRSKNPIHVLPSTQYYIVANNICGIRFYDSNDQFLGESYNLAIRNTSFVTPNSAAYMRFSVSDITSYANDICINLSDPAKNGTYEPYDGHSYPLDDSLTLRGIPTLVDGKIKFDGDIYSPSGKVTRKYGIVDLGTLTWSEVSGYSNVYKATVPYYTNKDDMVCAKYLKTEYWNSVSVMEDKTFKGYPNTSEKALYVKDTAYSTAETFKTAMSGVDILIPLDTPTTETADPYIGIQICDPNGTEEFVSTGIVPVGHNTKYPDNLRKKLDNLPWNFASLIAPTESGFTATRNYTTGALLIVNNVLYKATANIANGGTITVGTNVTATTLAEVIAALS